MTEAVKASIIGLSAEKANRVTRKPGCFAGYIPGFAPLRVLLTEAPCAFYGYIDIGFALPSRDREGVIGRFTPIGLSAPSFRNGRLCATEKANQPWPAVQALLAGFLLLGRKPRHGNEKTNHVKGKERGQGS